MPESRWRQYYAMTRPRVIFMVAVTAAWGYALGVGRDGLPDVSLVNFIAMLLGTSLAAAGGTVLNAYIERDVDALMDRTRNRPLPRGIIPPANALAFGLYLIIGGLLLLLWQVSLTAAFLVLLANFLYVLVYTPMKRLSALNTTIGAIPGAIPPMVGWAAARGYIGIEAWMLFTVLFVWQHPHVYAIAWMYREDYARAGFRMLSLGDDGRRTGLAVVVGCLALLLAATWPVLCGVLSVTYFVIMTAMGLFVFVLGRRLATTCTYAAARSLMRATVLYLPMFLASALIDMLL